MIQTIIVNFQPFNFQGVYPQQYISVSSQYPLQKAQGQNMFPPSITISRQRKSPRGSRASFNSFPRLAECNQRWGGWISHSSHLIILASSPPQRHDYSQIRAGNSSLNFTNSRVWSLQGQIFQQPSTVTGNPHLRPKAIGGLGVFERFMKVAAKVLEIDKKQSKEIHHPEIYVGFAWIPHIEYKIIVHDLLIYSVTRKG